MKTSFVLLCWRCCFMCGIWRVDGTAMHARIDRAEQREPNGFAFHAQMTMFFIAFHVIYLSNRGTAAALRSLALRMLVRSGRTKSSAPTVIAAPTSAWLPRKSRVCA